MDAEVWPDERVVRLVTENFIPARVHVREQPDDYRRFGERYAAQWTPTILELDPDGDERHRIEGFLPATDFLGQLSLGLAKMAFHRQEWKEAELGFQEVVDRYPESEAAPEALYWAGVARYKDSGDGRALAETAEAFAGRYEDTSWAKKASVWAKPA
ncbi:MAG TPA: thioredoxin fold domain-containing protein [Gemmatimonadota bacterium]|nr:thioredoxin fold domain-containing protein [Gemmatimonadota bacterium]